MGILNVTPDSFSDGDRYATVAAALARARRIEEEGAAIIDVGGESTRPGAAPVDEAVEIARVVPVIEGIAGGFGYRDFDRHEQACGDGGRDRGGCLHRQRCVSRCVRRARASAPRRPKSACV